MKKRPLSIVIIALIYFFEPAGNLIQAAYINNLPLFGENGIINHLIWSDWVILSLFPVVAVGIYMVRKWGWYLFIGFSALLIFYNLYVYFYLNPNYQLHTVLLFIIIVTAVSAIFFRKHVYAPYFNPRLRWWEVVSRYKVTLNTKILTDDAAIDCQTLDISTIGCFVNHTGDLNEGDSVWLIIQCSGIEINCLGKVVRKATETESPGYGIFFQAMSGATKLKIKNLIRILESLGGKDREGLIPASQIPNDVFESNRNIMNQLGKAKTSL